MIKRTLIALILTLVPIIGASAQEKEVASPATIQVPQYGYLSYKAIFEQMPEYAQAKEAFAQLKEKYEAEALRAEEEFQHKFSEFLQGQKDFPASIMQKRQAELQELMDKSVAFRKESQRLLLQAEAEMQAPVAEKLNGAIQTVAATRGLIFVLNTDGNAVPFVHPQAGIDISDLVLEQLGITPVVPPLP